MKQKTHIVVNGQIFLGRLQEQERFRDALREMLRGKLGLNGRLREQASAGPFAEAGGQRPAGQA